MDLKRLGKYEIGAKIGQGAMGQVHRAHDPILNRDVALKTMATEMDADDELRRRFHREAQSAARLNHPNIITIYDFGEEQGQMYIAMELLEGADLKEVITRQRPLTLDAKLDLMDQICDGLAFAHAREIIHRDLKPANIHLQADGKIKIVDFGLARISSAVALTAAGMMLGTPNYMSPEQVRGDKATTRSDVFALGAVFYELLAGRKAFDAEGMAAILFQVMQKEPEPLDRLRDELRPVWTVLQRALFKDPARRFAHAGELREALRDARKAVQAEAHRARPARPKPAPGETPSAAGTLVRPVEPEPATGSTLGALATQPTLAVGPTSDASAATPVPAVTRRPEAPPVRQPKDPDTLVDTMADTLGATQATHPGAPTVAVPLAEPTVAAPAAAPRGAARARPVGAMRPAPPPSPIVAVPRPGPSLLLLFGALAVAGLLAGVGLWLVLRDGSATRPPTTATPAATQAPPSSLVSTRPSLPKEPAATAPASTLPAEVTPAPVVSPLEASRLPRPDRPAPTPRTSTPSPVPRATPSPRATAAALPYQPPPSTLVVPTPVPVPPPSTAVPATTLPPPPVATTPPVLQSETAARQAIRGVLDEYRAAFERRDADALRAVQPGVDHEAMRKIFASVTGYTVRVDVKEVSVKGDEGRASCVVTYQPQPKPAQKIPPQNTVFHLRRTGDVWLIERLERR